MQYSNNIDSGQEGLLKTGEIMVKEGMIRLDDIDTVLSIQNKRQNSVSLEKKRLFGMTLCDLNLITPLENYCVLHKYRKLISVQDALISKKMLSRDMVTGVLKDSEKQGVPFISSLITKKCVPAAGMQTLLFDLFHIPFRSISDFIFNDKDRGILVKVLDKSASMEKKILPLMIKNNTLLFGITDPDNILFIHQLNERFPQYRFKAMFIPFSGFTWFYRILYEGIPALSGKKQPDAPLVMNFKALVQDPEKEKEIIFSLYQQYEQLRILSGNSKRENLQNEFFEFITLHHSNLAAKYQCNSIEFSLKQDGAAFKVVAFPVK